MRRKACRSIGWKEPACFTPPVQLEDAAAMRALTTVTGVQSLRSITARSSSARVLDLHSLAQDCIDDPEHRERPMFSHPVLNRTIIVKHHPRPGEFEYDIDHGAIVTK